MTYLYLRITNLIQLEIPLLKIPKVKSSQGDKKSAMTDHMYFIKKTNRGSKLGDFIFFIIFNTYCPKTLKGENCTTLLISPRQAGFQLPENSYEILIERGLQFIHNIIVPHYLICLPSYLLNLTIIYQFQLPSNSPVL